MSSICRGCRATVPVRVLDIGMSSYIACAYNVARHSNVEYMQGMSSHSARACTRHWNVELHRLRIQRSSTFQCRVYAEDVEPQCLCVYSTLECRATSPA